MGPGRRFVGFLPIGVHQPTLSLIENLISIAGLVTGFFCCSAIPPPSIEPPAAAEAPAMTTTEAEAAPVIVGLPRANRRKPTVPNSHVFICAPSVEQPVTVTTQEPLASSSEVSTSFWEEPAIHAGHAAARLRSTPVVCRWCQTTSPGDDCRDGFCSSVWNKENLMRPIHI